MREIIVGGDVVEEHRLQLEIIIIIRNMTIHFIEDEKRGGKGIRILESSL